MKSLNLRILSLLLAVIMSVSLLVSCTGETEDTEDGSTSGSTANTTDSETRNTESESGSEDTEETESGSSEETLPSLIEGENAALIENADRLANGVNAYFTDSSRTSFYFENKNVSVVHDLKDSKVVSAIANKNGHSYVENTMDVFLRMTDGTIHYASQGGENAIANIFRLGYYYYENRIEGLSFTDGYTFEDEDGKKLPHWNIIRYNQTELVEIDSEKNTKIKVNSNEDPYVVFGKVNYKAEDYNMIAITMRVDQGFANDATFLLIAGSYAANQTDPSSKPVFTTDQTKGFELICDGEYHTYYVPLNTVKDYKGTVNGLRLDMSPSLGSMNPTFDISDLRLLNADMEGSPVGVYLNKMFNTYSDKLHQTIQVAATKEVSNVQAVGIRTEIPADKVEKIVIKDKGGLHYSLEDKIAWNHVQYVGFDVKGAGTFGFILPYDGSGGTISVVLEDGVYVIEQIKSPESWTLTPSVEGTKNANDFYMGHRIYTDTYHSFDRFIAEAELEVNPLGEENFVIDSEASSFGEFLGYDALRGCYTLGIDGSGGFGPPYKLHQNRQYNVTFNLKGDGVNDRKIYVLTLFEGGGSLECAALLDGKQMMLPVPLEVGKNFSEGGDSPLFCMDDARYSETILPMVAGKDTDSTYSIVNLYYNWGKFPLKQISFIQYYAPYYHLSTGVHESNCITPYYFVNIEGSLSMLPDHRPMSGPFLEGDPQHTYCGVHSFLQYTDADGKYSASENILNTVGSHGPVYADVTMDFISYDGKIKATYNHMEFPQTDENRAYYEMKYEVLEDVSFKDFAHDFSFYSVTSLDPTGLYTKVGYLDSSNTSQVVAASAQGESSDIILGNNCPYFSFFDMDNSTHMNGYNNLSFLIFNSEFTIGGKKAEPSFLVVNDFAKLSLSLDLEEVTLKAGDSFTINAILMPWQYYDEYDASEPDKNVRRVRENTLLDPLTVTADKDCEAIESVFLPKVRTTNGKSAEFTLSGGHNNVAVRIYGFDKLTAPVVEEKIDGEWKLVDLSSFSTPDPFGYGYYYDGYAVYYDGDGTYSYAFVATMDNGAERTFRITAAEDFAGWPEIPKEEDPMNLWIDAQDLNAAFTTASARFGSFSLMAEDSFNFIRVNRNGTASEATLTLFDNAEGALAGRYLVYKIRVPQGSAAKLNTWQFYTATEHTMYDEEGNILIVGEDYNASCPTLSDGKWHVIVIDLEAYGKSDSFRKADDGNYYVKYLRYDTFNPEYATDATVDIAYIAFHDSLDEILEYNKDQNTVAFFESSSYYEHISTKQNEALNLHMDASELDAMVDKFKSRFHSVTLSENRDYITFAGSVGAEAIVDLFRGNSKETGQYLVLKYRLPKSDKAPFGYWQFYTNTDGGAAGGSNGYSCEGHGTMVISDGEWQVLIVDLAARGYETYAKNDDGKYVAKFFRFDFFNSQFAADVTYDVEYIAFSNSLDDILEYESDMDYVTLATAQKESKKLDPKTGNEISE